MISISDRRPQAQPRQLHNGTQRDLALEALRGCAAIVVVFWHCMLGFFPQWSGIFPDRFTPGASLAGFPWFGLIYGTSAVTIFFVLSGFVLTRRFFLGRDPAIIVRGLIKRWPRLMGPVLVTVMFSFLLFRWKGYAFIPAGQITGSPWLTRFAYAYQTPFTPHLGDAIAQSVYGTFFLGQSSYDSSLWTMKIEFIGSFIAYGLALATTASTSQTGIGPAWIFGIIFVLCYVTSPEYAAFPAGAALAFVLPSKAEPLGLPLFATILLICIFLLGYSGADIGAYRWLWSLAGTRTIAVHVVASVGIIAAIETAPPRVRHALSGRSARFLGELSFPLYLIHVLVLCSLGASVYLAVHAHWPAASSPVAAAMTLFAAILAAIPLMAFNRVWMSGLNRAVERVMRPDRESPIR